MSFRQSWLLLFFLHLVIYPVTVFSEKPANDSTEVLVRHFNEEQLNGYLNDKDFQYDREPPPSVDTGLLEYIFYKIGSFITMLLSIDGLGSILSALPYILVAIAIIIIVLNLMKGNIRSFITGEGRKSNIDYKVYQEDIHAIDFDKAIRDAIEEKNYRKAIRLLYLKTLKKLSDAQLIEWRINKTNHDYARELRSSNYGKTFSEITNVFDRIWYGHFDIDESSFRKVEVTFTKFNQQLTNTQ